MIGILVNSLAGGGAERIALTLLSELKATGHDVILFCLEHEQSYQISPNIEVVYLTDNKKLTNPLYKIPWIFISAYRLSNQIRKRKIEILQSHLIRSNLINAAAKMFGAHHQAQIVSHSSLKLKGSYFTTRVKRLFYKWLYGRADQVVSISEIMKKMIDQSLKLNPEIDHVVINNPHDLVRIQNMAEEEVDEFCFNPKVRYIISIGRQLRFKRIDLVIDALDKIRTKISNVELIVLGDGDDKAFFQARADALNLNKFVHFLGHKSNPFSFLGRSEILILSSENEGLPNIIIESLSCGVPVISTDCISGPREILSPDSDFDHSLTNEVEYAKYGVLYPVNRADLLVEAILKLLSDDDLRIRYKNKGLGYVSKYDKSNITRQYFDKFLISTPIKLETVNH
ncbi:MAG: glycosyltransferase [Saprospiraceae bacterium]|nr:glycosyltransferase [Saprospiraceae bacterium]